MHLKIDLGVRKQLMERVKDEIDELRSMSNTLLRENGALDFQLRQLTAGTPRREVIDAPSPAPEQQQSEPFNSDGRAEAPIG